MKKPRTLQSNGASQLSLLPQEPFCPRLPSVNSAARIALDALLVTQSLTQIDWLRAGHGWRLAAAIMDLNYLGWNVQSNRVHHKSRIKPIASYSLDVTARRVAVRLCRGRNNDLT